MKNFKKVLALVLALATLLSFATVAGAAVDTTAIYADADDVKYVEAVDVLTAIGVLNGKGASYKPNDTLKRSEAAKIIAMFDNGDTDISKLYNPANTFVDVASDYWAVSYIAYCAKQGIISGVGNNKYAPESKLTGIQFLKMVLVTLGYDAKEEGLVGTSWKVNVLKLARAAGLTDVLGKKYDYDAELTRDAAAQIMLNALNAKTVTYGQEIKTSGRKNVLTTAGAIENDSYLYESWDLTKKVDQDDAFGRPCHIWKYGKDTIGTYVEAPLASYTVAVAGCDVLNDCDFDEDGVKLTTYEDGVEGSTRTIKNTTANDIGGQGVLTQVYEDRIVFINTYLAKVTKVVTEKRDAKDHVTRKAATTMNVWLGTNGSQFDKVGDTAPKTFESDAFAKDDMVLVTIADGDVQTVETAESKIAEFTKIKRVDGKFAQVALDGEFSDIAAKYFYDGIDANDLGSDMVAYFDAYGNVIGMEAYYAPLNYAVIDALWVESIKGKATIKADLVTAAGDKLEDVEITSVTVNGKFFDKKAAKDDDTAFSADDLIALAGGTTNVVFAKNDKLTALYDTLFAYTTEDGVYKLSLNGKGIWDDTVYNEVKTEKAASFTNGSSYVKDAQKSVVFQMTSETLVLVRDSGTSVPFATYTAYVGYDEVPSMTGDVQYHVNKDTNKVDVVYVNNITVSGTKTVIFFAGADRFAGAKSGGKFPIEFDAYALDKDAGTLTAATYIFKSSDKEALKDMKVGFYEVYVSDSNEISLVTDADNDGKITEADLLSESGKVVNATSASGKADEKGNYIEIGSVKVDGGDADVVTYVLDGAALKDGNFADLANGDKLYVYKSDDKFTIVNAASLAAIKAVDSEKTPNTVLGVVTSDDQTIGHTYQGMVISEIPAGMEVKKVSFKNEKDTDVEYTTAKQWENNQKDVVNSDITITLDWLANYKVATLKATVNGLGTVSSTTITATPALDYTVSELLDVLEAGLSEDVATIELKYGANFVDTDSELHFDDNNKGAWSVVVTSGNGLVSTTYIFA